MQANRLPARQGLVWVIAGYRLFRANPALLSLLAFAYLVTFMVMLTLPAGLGGVLFPILQPMLALAIANGCRGIADSSQKAGPPADLLAGIRTRAGPLARLGSLQLVGSLLVILALFLFDMKPNPGKPDQLMQVMALAALLSLPFLLAFWFAPLLTGWHNVPPLKSAFFSFIAGLRNWRAFLVYALSLIAIVTVPTLLAVFAMGVSETFGQILAKVVEIVVLILVLPIFLAGSFLSYRDIFTTTPAANG